VTSEPIKLYNTLTRRKQDFTPIDAKNVRMYVCGPTVYDYAHIGNARPVIVFDVLYRLLRHTYGEECVTYVRNITDVDDKINARAARDFPDLPLNEAIRAVTEKTTKQYQADMTALGCLEPTYEPRATDYIEQMVEMIQTLIDKDHAYVASGRQGREVLFRVGSMKNYGALSNRKLEDQQAGARVAVESHKENAGDFVLWKESSANEPGWDGTFDGAKIHGRPGWHIECSAMAKALLGKTFDIHGGGLDLIFPHHENEIAQSCCANNTDKMANIWMHNGFLQVEGKKMSKSDGNFITVNDVLETDKVGGRKWPGEVVRMAMLMAHYRGPIDFSVRRLEEAEKIFELMVIGYKTYENAPQDTAGENAIRDCLLNDLNTVAAIKELYRFVRNTVGLRGIEDDAAGETYTPVARAAAGRMISAAKILGFLTEEADEWFRKYKQNNIDENALNKKITKRLTFIANKNWPEADRIRDELLAQGIQLKDSKDSETGERVTTWEVKR